MELNKSNQSIGGGDSSSDLAKSQWDETKVNDKVDVASSAIDQDKDTEIEKSADKAKASRLKKLVAGVAAIGLALAVSGGVHAYHQHVENQRVAEAVKEEQAANQRRQKVKVLNRIFDGDDLSQDENIYDEADWVLGRYDAADSYGVNASSRARLKSPKEFEECFHITPEDYQKQCLEKYGINADDFADDTKAEALQRYNEVKQDVEECAAKWGYGELRAIFDSRELRALLDGDFSYFKKSKESKVKQALEDKIDELERAEYEAKRRERNDVDPEYDSRHPEDAKVTSPKGDSGDKEYWSDDDGIDRRERAYYEHESEQRNREEIPDTIDLQ